MSFSGRERCNLLQLAQMVLRDGQIAVAGAEGSAKTEWPTRDDPTRRRFACLPDSPWENGYNERFNGTPRHEVLNAEGFDSTTQAQIVINQWLKQYNHIRPYHAFGDETGKQ